MDYAIDDLKCCHNCKHIEYSYGDISCRLGVYYKCKHGGVELLEVINKRPIYDNPSERSETFWEFQNNRIV